MAACQQSLLSAIMILRVSSYDSILNNRVFVRLRKLTINHVQNSGNVAGGYLNVNAPQDDPSVSVNEKGVQGI